jgi:hypothetical protein
MLKRATRALIATFVIAAGAAGSASAAGFDTNHGKPTDPDQSACVAFFSNGGAQAGFIQDVQSGGPGAVGESSREFGTSGGLGGTVPHNCS